MMTRKVDGSAGKIPCLPAYRHKDLSWIPKSHVKIQHSLWWHMPAACATVGWGWRQPAELELQLSFRFSERIPPISWTPGECSTARPSSGLHSYLHPHTAHTKRVFSSKNIDFQVSNWISLKILLLSLHMPHFSYRHRKIIFSDR